MGVVISMGQAGTVKRKADNSELPRRCATDGGKGDGAVMQGQRGCVSCEQQSRVQGKQEPAAPEGFTC